MDYDAEGKEVLKCGFKIGGGIDQNFKKSPQGYTDSVSYLIFYFSDRYIQNKYQFQIELKK